MTNESIFPYKTKQSGSVGSPSSNTEIAVDILSSASKNRLVGSMFFIESEQDAKPMVITGQITETIMNNRYHQNDIYRTIVKQDGFIPYLSGTHDVITAKYSVGAVFLQNEENQWVNDTLGNVPFSGTAVSKLTQEVVDDLVKEQKEDIFQFGFAYGDNSVRIPMYLKHFGNPQTGGYGEAHHTLVVGKTGSGKSTLAKMMLSGYARHNEMAMIIIDPKGEFSEEINGFNIGESGFPFKTIMDAYERKCYRYGITEIKLETWELFLDILESLELHKDMNVSAGDNAEELFKCIEDVLKKEKIKLTDLGKNGVLEYVLEQIISETNTYSSQIYKSEEPRNRMIKNMSSILDDPNHRARKTWGFISFLFSDGNEKKQRKSISRIINSIIYSKKDRPIISIDLSVPGNKKDMDELLSDNNEFEIDEEKDLFTESLQKKIIYRIVSELRRNSEDVISKRTRTGDRDNINTMIVFEEAHRFAPKFNDSSDPNGKKLTQKLIEGVRETRKYGLAWFFIDQTIGGIHREITQQVRTLWAGFGLSMGDELERLKEIIGGDSSDMNLYQSFKDPAGYANNKDKKYPWIVFGPVSPMVANRPLFINAFSSEQFTDYNSIALSGKRIDKSSRSVLNKKKKIPSLAQGKHKPIGGLNELGDETFEI